MVLAGGQSRRMGRDKALLPVEGTTVLDRTIRVLEQLSDDVIVVGRRSAAGQSKPRFVPDAVNDVGPLGGLATGIKLLRRPYAICVGCDMPFLDGSVLTYLVTQSDGYDAVVSRIEGKSQPLHAVY